LVQPSPADERPVEIGVAGQSYFTERLFRDILLRDKDLAQSFLLNEKKPLPVRKILAAIAAVILLLFSAGLIASYAGNRRLIERALECGVRIEEINRADIGKDLTRKSPVEAAVELNALEEAARPCSSSMNTRSRGRSF
jgi:type VI protein secretion system component VasK